MKNKDCFAYIKLSNGEETCGALNDIKCKDCNFYKPKYETDSKTLQLIKEEKKRLEDKEEKKKC